MPVFSSQGLKNFITKAKPLRAPVNGLKVGGPLRPPVKGKLFVPPPIPVRPPVTAAPRTLNPASRGPIRPPVVTNIPRSRGPIRPPIGSAMPRNPAPAASKSGNFYDAAKTKFKGLSTKQKRWIMGGTAAAGAYGAYRAFK